MSDQQLTVCVSDEGDDVQRAGQRGRQDVSERITHTGDSERITDMLLNRKSSVVQALPK